MKKIFPIILMILFSLNAKALFEVKDSSDNTVLEVSQDGLRIFNMGDTLMVISSTEIKAFIDESAKDRALSRSFSITTATAGKGGGDVVNIAADGLRVYNENDKLMDITGSNITAYIDSNSTKALSRSFSITTATAGKNGFDILDVTTETTKMREGTHGNQYTDFSEDNIFLGLNAGLQTLPSGFDGSNNVFIGNKSGASNTLGSSNTFLGDNSGFSNDEGLFNVFIGYKAGYSSTDKASNTYIGNQAGELSNGDANTFMGYSSGQYNVSGASNSFYGWASSRSNEAGYNNSSFGAGASFYNSNGYNNVVMGFYAGYGSSNSTYSFNSLFGSHAGYLLTSGSNNVMLGNKSGYLNTTGSVNVFIGNNAGYNETGSNRLYIDNFDTSDPLIYGEFDNNLIKINGALSTTETATFNGTRTSVIHPLGNTTNGLFIQSTYDNNTDSWHFYQSTGDHLDLFYNTTLRGRWDLTSGVYTSSSDKKFKKNIEKLTKVMDKVMLLQPKKYNFISQKNNGDKYIGLIAQDVEKLFPEFVMYNEEADAYTMDYAGLSVVAIQAIQEQQIAIEENKKLKAEIEYLRLEIEEIKKLLNK